MLAYAQHVPDATSCCVDDNLPWDGGRRKRTKGLSATLYDLGCSEAQVEYIARYAELHFELSKVCRATIDGTYNDVVFQGEVLEAELHDKNLNPSPNVSIYRIKGVAL